MSSYQPAGPPLGIEMLYFAKLVEHDALKSDKPALLKVIPLSSETPTFDANRVSELVLELELELELEWREEAGERGKRRHYSNNKNPNLRISVYFLVSVYLCICALCIYICVSVYHWSCTWSGV